MYANVSSIPLYVVISYNLYSNYFAVRIPTDIWDRVLKASRVTEAVGTDTPRIVVSDRTVNRL
jgi:hypothetical protein